MTESFCYFTYFKVERPVDLDDFMQVIVPGVELLKTSSSFKWAYETGNQGIYSAPETIVLYQALHFQHCFSCLLVYQGII